LQNNTTETPQTPKTKKRNGCLTAWLILTIAFSLIFIFVYLSGGGVSVVPGGSRAVPVLVLLLILEIICAVALFSWKKWGFWGFCAVNIVGLGVDFFLGISLLWSSITVVTGIIFLFAVLNIGKEDKGWPQLD
jgi:hypothetical protein